MNKPFLLYRVLPVITILLIVLSCNAPTTDKPSKNGKAAKKPNIIFILTDDLGYGDLGVIHQNQRAEAGKPHHKTPHLDAMANKGMLLKRHYVPAPVCAPSRASLLLGVHQGHANVRNNQFDKALANNHTLASVMKEAGYSTGIVGKYGLQGEEGSNPATWQAYPTKRGFDYFFGYVRHRDGHNHYPAHEALERPKVELYHQNEEISGKLKGAYTTDLFTAAAKKWITQRREADSEQPFFLYLAYDTPHAGLQIGAEPYPEGGGLNGGVQWIGEKGNFINTASESIDDYIHPDYADKDWPSQHKRFASMVRRIDNGVGDIRQLLKDLEIEEETLIVFSSDNGPHSKSYGYGDYDPTLFHNFGPLDGIKRDTWEGGIRMPTVVHWPGKVPAGTIDNTPSSFVDWMPTFAELGDVPAPARTDGVSLVPMITGKGNQSQPNVYIEYYNGGKTPEYAPFDPSHRGQRRKQMQVIYLDGYKGVRYDIQSSGDDFRIYDTEKDPGERNNLAGSSDYFSGLQQRMKDRVLQLRRPNESAERPYDEIPVPALSLDETPASGLQYQVYEVNTPWVPDVASLSQSATKTGTVDGFDPTVRSRDNNIVINYQGVIEVPQTGKYTFSLSTNSGALLRIHDATVIDADKGYKPNSMVSAEILLEKGYHPVTLTYANKEDARPALEVHWEGQGIDNQPLGHAKLGHIQKEDQ